MNTVSTKIVATRGSQGVQVSMMIPLGIAPIDKFSTENLVPYFQLPTRNPLSRFSNFGGPIPMRGGGSPLHGNGGPPRGGSGPLEGGGKPPSAKGAPRGGGGIGVPFGAPWLSSPYQETPHCTQLHVTIMFIILNGPHYTNFIYKAIHWPWS